MRCRIRGELIPQARSETIIFNSISDYCIDKGYSMPNAQVKSALGEISNTMFDLLGKIYGNLTFVIQETTL